MYFLWKAQACLEHTDILKEKWFALFFFSTSKFEFHSRKQDEARTLFPKHVITTQRMSIKHTIMAHIRSPASRIPHLPSPLYASVLSGYKPQCVSEEPKGYWAQSRKRAQISWMTLGQAHYARCLGNFKKNVLHVSSQNVYSFTSSKTQYPSPPFIRWNPNPFSSYHLLLPTQLICDCVDQLLICLSCFLSFSQDFSV